MLGRQLLTRAISYVARAAPGARTREDILAAFASLLSDEIPNDTVAAERIARKAAEIE